MEIRRFYTYSPLGLDELTTRTSQSDFVYSTSGQLAERQRSTFSILPIPK